MQNLSNTEIAEALLSWADNLDDFKLKSFIRSLGFTLDEIVTLSLDDEQLKRALSFAFDSIEEKIIHKVMLKHLNTDIAKFLLNYYNDRFSVEKRTEAPVLRYIPVENIDKPKT